MIRRNFFGATFGALATALGLPGKKAEAVTISLGDPVSYAVDRPTFGHYYDCDGPDGEFFTTDPRYQGKFDYGSHNLVLVDGVDGGRVQRFYSGPNGWVQRVDDEGRREWLRGQVTYYDLRVDKDPRESPKIHLYDDWNGGKLAGTFYGDVFTAAPGFTEPTPRFQCHDPNKTDGEGRLVPRWREESDGQGPSACRSVVWG